MRLLQERPAKPIVAVASLWMIAALAASCSATPPATGPPPPSPSPTASATPPAHSVAPAVAVFTVTGNNPVTVNGSQDTNAATPTASCDASQLSADRVLGNEIVDGFTLGNFPTAANLLAHFLTGTGTEVDFGIGSLISEEAVASSEFRAVNAEVQSEIALQLKAKVTRVR